MITLMDPALAAKYRDGYVIVSVKSGAELRFPVAQNPRLAVGSLEHLAYKFCGIIEGNYGQHPSAHE